MKRTTLFATLAGALLVSATAFGISAAVDSPRSLMSPNDYSVARKAIESDGRVAATSTARHATCARPRPAPRSW